MDMNINRHFLRQQRENRAWTQNQLAEVADLSLRTVQRIEQTGVASKESAMALASALEASLAELCEQSNTAATERRFSGKVWGGAIGILFGCLLSFGWWSSAAADQVMMKLLITTPLGDISELQLLNDFGQESEFQLDSQLRLLVTASKQGEQVLLSNQVYDFIEGEYRLIASPAILVANREPAEIHLDTVSSGRVEMRFEVDY